MKKSSKAFWIFIFSLLPYPIFAGHFGGQISSVIVSHEISQLQGYQLLLNYQPEKFIWDPLSLYFDAGWAHFWVPHTNQNRTLDILAASPVLRITLVRFDNIIPYAELSLGIAYLSQTKLDGRNLGIHFSFQDRVGIGALLGKDKKLSLGFHIAHYSNAHFSEHNSGISLPVILDIGYRFN